MIWFVLLVFFLLLTFWPILLALVGGYIAYLNDCHLDEGGAHPCVILGHDYGVTLNALAVMPWFEFIFFPIGIACLTALTVAWLVKKFFMGGG